jgi:PAS domain S-box-containing protein
VPTALQPGQPRDRAVHIAGVVLALVIFGADVQVPLGYAIGILYVLVILLGLWTSWPAYPALAAFGATFLLLADLAIGWGPDVTPFVYVNRPLMVLVFAVTAGRVTAFRRLERHALGNVEQLADFKRALDHAAIVATTDVTGRITYVNDKFCEISGYTREELIGQDHRLINSGYHPKSFIRDLWRTIANGQVWNGEIRNRAKEGRFYWVDTTIVPFLDARGKPYQYIAIRADITARKAAEETLRQQAGLARVGQMAAVVAHEVRNPLAGIKGAIQVLMSRRSPGDGELPVMRDIVARIDALGDLINDLMVFARPRPPRLGAVDLRPLIEEAVATVRRDPVAERVVFTVTGEPVSAVVDRDLVRATLLNLLLNAAQAMGGRGEVGVTLARRDAMAVIDVQDNGPGVPADLRDQVFEPFFTTKARGGGLGLPVARRTAEIHGGSLALACPDGGGTLVTLTLPLRPSLPPDGALAAAAAGSSPIREPSGDG